MKLLVTDTKTSTVCKKHRNVANEYLIQFNNVQLNIQFNIQFKIQYSIFNIQYSIFNIQLKCWHTNAGIQSTSKEVQQSKQNENTRPLQDFPNSNHLK